MFGSNTDNKLMYPYLAAVALCGYLWGYIIGRDGGR